MGFKKRRDFGGSVGTVRGDENLRVILQAVRFLLEHMDIYLRMMMMMMMMTSRMVEKIAIRYRACAGSLRLPAQQTAFYLAADVREKSARPGCSIRFLSRRFDWFQREAGMQYRFRSLLWIFSI